MRLFWRAKLVFAVSATDVAMAHQKAFAVFIDGCRLARREGIGAIRQPVYNLEDPNRYQPFLARFPVRYPPPAEHGEKSAHEVWIDLQYVKVDSDWESTDEARDWLRSLFQQVQSDDCQLVAAEDSNVFWS